MDEDPQHSPSQHNEIEFEPVPDAEVPELEDQRTTKMKDQVIRKLDREVIEDQEREDRGQDKGSLAPVPKEVPEVLFRMGAHVLECDRFKLEDDEARIIAKHLTNIIGENNSKVYSAIIIILVIAGKLLQCKDAIMSKFKHKSVEEPAAPQKPKGDLLQ